MFLYGSVAFLYILGIFFLANYIYKIFGLFESLFVLVIFWYTCLVIIFCFFLLESKLYSIFYVPIYFIKQINENSSVIYFHVSGIILNIIVQMMPQTINLIPALPSYFFIQEITKLLNQLLHVFIQLILVYPWIHFYLFILEWENHKIAGKLFKNFSAIFEYMNFLGGWELTSEYIDYAFYGTNTYPIPKIFDAFLTFSSILLIMIIYSIFLTFSKIKLHKYI